ncbi:MAG TPA: ABC transporter permease, partial [Verrucomicrobiota bacterium]|nr:ABC transporter permease [Verrucomicrobiota bacterium]
MTTTEKITVYTPESPLRAPVKLLRSMFRDLLASRELAWRIFVRNNSAQYRQTMLGYVWAFLPPIATSLTFVFLSSQKVVNIGNTGGVPYPAFVIIGTTF